jgi:hypothetical protein
LILLADVAITDYEAVQERPSQLRVCVKLAADADPGRVTSEVRHLLVAGLKELGAAAPQVEVQAGNISPVAGKLRRVRCLKKIGAIDKAAS